MVTIRWSCTEIDSEASMRMTATSAFSTAAAVRSEA
ncbi:hypothetical protein SVIOM342S_00263 [Streptomyces violaceorubidus]